MLQCWARSVELAGLSHIRVEPEIMIGITNRFIVPVGYCQAIDLAVSAVLQQLQQLQQFQPGGSVAFRREEWQPPSGGGQARISLASLLRCVRCGIELMLFFY
jgi:hypothetical protein